MVPVPGTIRNIFVEDIMDYRYFKKINGTVLSVLTKIMPIANVNRIVFVN